MLSADDEEEMDIVDRESEPFEVKYILTSRHILPFRSAMDNKIFVIKFYLEPPLCIC